MNFDQTINAVSITSQTLVGVSGTPPFKRGNCFSVLAEGGEKEYRVVNFCLENLEALMWKGLSWPIKILPISEQITIIHDKRIGDQWYMDRFCEVCCPEELLPLLQQAKLNRMDLRGERTKHKGWVSFHPPTITVL